MFKPPTIVQRAVSPTRQRIFLEELAIHGCVAQASRVASPHARDRKGASGSFYSLRRRDPHFAAEWDGAQEQADAKLLVEARRRAIDGVERGIFQKGTQATTADGKPATKKVYSDRLLELLLKSRFPNDFVERRQVEHHHAPSGWQITAEDLHALSDSQVEQLQTIMETVMVARGETEPDLAMGTALIDVTPETIETEPDDSERLNPYRG